MAGVSCRPEPMVIPGAGNARSKQVPVVMNGLDDVDEEGQELQVGASVIARRQQNLVMAVRQRPVAVLPATVEPGKRLLPKQDSESMFDRGLCIRSMSRRL